MGIELTPPPVQFFCALLGESKEHIAVAVQKLDELGYEPEWLGPGFDFEGTSYYEDELGHSPYRAFVRLGGPSDRTRLVQIKKHTNQIENELFGGPRKVNLDPGYLSLGQVFLATTKDQRHRIYLSDGIFAEVTLYFEGKKCCHFPWTYYDWQSERYKEVFLGLRQMHRKDLQNLNRSLESI